jgi:M6 family metalloprotease-like protein
VRSYIILSISRSHLVSWGQKVKFTKSMAGMIMSAAMSLSLFTGPVSATEQILVDGKMCQLTSPNQYSPFSFPRAPERLKATGTVRAIMLFVDFPDAVATDQRKIRKVANRYIRNFRKFYREQSYGQLDFRVDVVNRYFRLPNTSKSYKMNLQRGDDGSGAGQYFRDALDAADPTVNFAGYDAVFVIPSNTNREITYGPSFPMPAGNDLLRTDEGVILNGVVAGTDSRLRSNSLEWSWLAHETGHLFGIEHPWRLNSDPQGRSEYSAEIAVWDLMVKIGDGKTGEFLAWSRFQVGWISPERVTCINASGLSSGGISFGLVPLWKPGAESNFAFIPTSSGKGIGIEVRENNGLNRFPKAWEGPLIYEVDATVSESNGGIRILSNRDRRFQREIIGTLRVGQRVLHDGIVIQYTGKKGENYSFKISRR